MLQANFRAGAWAPELPEEPTLPERSRQQRQIRCLHFGKRRNVYRILYEIDESQKTVYILLIRHGALRDFDPAQ